MVPSTSLPERLPAIPALRRVTKSLAMLDAIIEPEWQYRYYSYNSRWSTDEEMASMRDGCGDDWFLLFGSCGAALKGFAHESPIAGDPSFPLLIQKTVPASFHSFLNEPAFSMDVATFCLWRECCDSTWNVVQPAVGRSAMGKDGSAELLRILDGNPRTYQAWAEAYYERDVPLEVVRAIYNHVPLSADLLSALNPEVSLADIETDVAEIGYPHGLNA